MQKYQGFWTFLGGLALVAVSAGFASYLLRTDPDMDTVGVREIGPGVYRAGPLEMGRYTRPVSAKRVQAAFEEFAAKDGRKPYVLVDGSTRIEFFFPPEADWKRWEQRKTTD